MEWISVKDRLPSIGENVLVYDERFIDISIGYISDFLNYRKTWIVDCGESVSDTVTHWMPLPEPPKEVNHGRGKEKAD